MSLFHYAMTASLLTAIGLFLPTTQGQGQDTQPPNKSRAEVNVMRQVYAVRGSSAKDLAGVLNQHFQAEPAFRAVADAGSNVLLLSGPKAVVDDAMAVLREIDRPARTVVVEILLLEIAGKAGGDGAADAKPLDPSELSGPSREVHAKVRDLQRRGIVNNLKSVELTGVTGQSARTQIGENKPYVTSVTSVGGAGGFGGRGGGGAGGVPGGGTMARSITYRTVGLNVQVKPEVCADGLIALDLHIEDSNMRGADSGALGTDEKGTAVSAAEFVTATVETRAKVRPGTLIVAQGTKSNSKASWAQTIILVGARTEENK
jgi:Flp pilus assembly secretin CpaC